ncbi:S10 family peptidase [Pleionea sediminis]|uniref:S10 family peptidase n=1 Tax=Pleionea sediminis TaxID=2569479 RepID=UPI0011856A1E|nr:peptidase S10 [Pleionea sediminis]
MQLSVKVFCLLMFVFSSLVLSAVEKANDELPDHFPEEVTSVTEHSVRVGDERIDYKAIAGTSFVFNEQHEKIGNIFYTAYVKENAKKSRPITFAYNGGPGSASVWLHMGALGPKRVVMDDEGFMPKPPYQAVDNAYSILDLTDIVFIDPVGTGYSRAAGKGTNEDFHGTWEDIKTVSEFIRLYLTRNNRWSSPKYLAGESYGTLRSAGIAYHMGQNLGVNFNGILLISNVLNYTLDNFDHGVNIQAPITLLPTYTATAFYHKKLDGRFKSIDEAIQQAKDFAMGDYALALLQGDNLSDQKKKSTAQKLAELTGLPKELILRNNLIVNMQTFVHQLRRSEGMTLGRLDSRFVTPELNAFEQPGYRDPSYMAIHGPYTETLMTYLRKDLKFETDLVYHILGGGVKSWNTKEFADDSFDMSRKLRHAMLRNPDMKVFVANGYFDMATPFFSTEYNFSHMGLPEQLQDNVKMTYYESGHMMYIRKADLIKFKKDIKDFFKFSL